MINYIRSEIYRILRYKWTYLFIAICSVLLLSSNILLAAVKYSDRTFPYATTWFTFLNAFSSMSLIYIFCMVVSGMIFNNEYRNHTMKNSISYGYLRSVIFFGKLIVQIIYSIIAFVIILGVYIISAYLLLEDSGSFVFNILVRACLACVPLFISGLAVANCFLFVSDGTGGAIIAASNVMIALPTICKLLGRRFDIFQKISDLQAWTIMQSPNYDPTTKLVTAYWDTQSGFINCWIIGIATTALISIIGYVSFRKKEIK